MVIINAERKPKAECASKAPTQDRQAQNQACIALLEQWLADDSGYDEAAWPQVQRLLEENRSSACCSEAAAGYCAVTVSQ